MLVSVTNVPPRPLFLCDDLSGEDHDNISTNKESGGLSSWLFLYPNQEFTQLASEEQITKTVQALETNGIRTLVVETDEEARTRVLDMIPSGVEVYNSVSRTLELIGLAADIE